MGLLQPTGDVLGRPVKVWMPPRRSVADCSPLIETLFWGDDQIRLDVDRMQPRLAKLLPTPYCRATSARHWAPFIRKAISMGLL
jgi:hypothetical protein